MSTRNMYHKNVSFDILFNDQSRWLIKRDVGTFKVFSA